MNNPTNTTQGIDLDTPLMRSHLEHLRHCAPSDLATGTASFFEFLKGEFSRQQTPVTGKVGDATPVYLHRAKNQPESNWWESDAAYTEKLKQSTVAHHYEFRTLYTAATHQATLAAPDEHRQFIEKCEALTKVARKIEELPTLAAPALIQALETGDDRESSRWFDITPGEVAMYTEEGYKIRVLYEGAVPASPPKPAASQQANTVPEQQEKVAPPPRGTGSQQEASDAAWISVDERLPEFGAWCTVLVDRDLGDFFNRLNKPRFDVYAAQLRDIDGEGYASWQRWKTPDGGPIGSLTLVSHWMPLPLPPDASNTAGAAKGGANNDNKE